MINFIVSDIRNTLLKHGETKVSEDIIDLILKLKDAGIRFAVATGKDYNSVKKMFGRARNDIIYICSEGGSIIYNDELIKKTPINRRICFEVVTEAEKNKNIRLLFTGERSAMVTTRDSDFVTYLNNSGIETEYVKDVKEIHEDITKIAIYLKDGLTPEEYKHFYTKWGNMTNVSAATANQAYLTGQNVTKGNALGLIQELYGISPEDTMIFASNYTSIDLFEHSYFTYALMDADNEIKNSAKHMTDSLSMILEDVLRMQ